jgi:hypothetical protein
MTSRFGLEPGALAKGSGTPQGALPTCKPCQERDHGRCATVLSQEHIGAFASDFNCACYRSSEEMHQDVADRRQEEFEENRYAGEEHSGYSHYGDPGAGMPYGDDSARGRNHRHYVNWLEEM